MQTQRHQLHGSSCFILCVLVIIDCFKHTILLGGTAYLTAAGLDTLAISCFGSMACEEECMQSECLIWDQDQIWFNPREDAKYNPPNILYRKC